MSALYPSFKQTILSTGLNLLTAKILDPEPLTREALRDVLRGRAAGVIAEAAAAIADAEARAGVLHEGELEPGPHHLDGPLARGDAGLQHRESPGLGGLVDQDDDRGHGQGDPALLGL